jgi:hypothetical protein
MVYVFNRCSLFVFVCHITIIRISDNNSMNKRKKGGERSEDIQDVFLLQNASIYRLFEGKP